MVIINLQCMSVFICRENEIELGKPVVNSCFLFAFSGNLKIFQDDGVFWVTFSCISVIIPVVFIGCLRIVSVSSSEIYSSYCPGPSVVHLLHHFACLIYLGELHENL